jgi:Domain of unknown function (DUF4833)
MFLRLPTTMTVRMPIPLRTPSALALAAAALAWLAAPAARALPSFGPYDVHSAFYVSKSENQNQVHYAVQLDSGCHPVGTRPVFAYWRRLRQGARVDAPLEGLGTRYYGASDVQQVTRTAEGGKVRMHVKALDRLPVDITVVKREGRCVATATTTIAKGAARLDHAHLQLGRLGLMVRYVDVFGTRLSDGAAVKERLD